MAGWIKNALMLVFLGVWAVVILVHLARDKNVDPMIWPLPGGLWVLLNPPALRLGPAERASATGDATADGAP